MGLSPIFAESCVGSSPAEVPVGLHQLWHLLNDALLALQAAHTIYLRAPTVPSSSSGGGSSGGGNGNEGGARLSGSKSIPRSSSETGLNGGHNDYDLGAISGGNGSSSFVATALGTAICKGGLGVWVRSFNFLDSSFFPQNE